MDAWEYMTMKTQMSQDGRLQIAEVAGPTYRASFHDVDPGGGGDETLRRLDLLGVEGWELVSVNEQHDRFTLKRHLVDREPEVDILDTIH